MTAGEGTRQMPTAVLRLVLEHSHSCFRLRKKGVPPMVVIKLAL